MASAFEIAGGAPVSTESGTAVVTSSGETVQQSSAGSPAKVIEVSSRKRYRSSGGSTKRSTPDPEPEPEPVKEDPAPQPETPELYDAQTGRKLSPFEAYGATVTQGAQTTGAGETTYNRYDPPERRLFPDSYYRDYPYLAARDEAIVKERIQQPATAFVRDVAERSAFVQRTEASLKDQLRRANTEQEFELARSNLRGFQKDQILRGRETYGDITSKNPFKVVVGGFSLGAKSIGQATENLLFEQEEKLRFKDRQAIGTDETGVYAVNVLKDSARDVAIGGLKVSRGLIGGAVTDTGSSPLQAAFFVASGAIGTVSGVVKGSGAAAKFAQVTSKSVYLRSAVKGTGLGLKTVGYGAIGVAGFRAATSDDPLLTTSRLGGQLLSFAGAFKGGQAIGESVGLGASSALTQAQAYLVRRRLPGKTLTTAQTRSIEALKSRGLDVRVQAKPVREVGAAELRRGGYTITRGEVLKTGAPRLVDPSKAARDYVLVNAQKLTINQYSPGVARAPYSPGTVAKISKSLSSGSYTVTGGKESLLFSGQSFDRLFSGKTVKTYTQPVGLERYGTISPDRSLTLIRGQQISGFNVYPSTGFTYQYTPQIKAPFKAATPPASGMKDLVVVSTPSSTGAINLKTGDFFVISKVTTGKNVFGFKPPISTAPTPTTSGGSVVSGSAGGSVILKQKPIADQKTVFKPLSAYQGGDASFNPQQDVKPPKEFTDEYYQGRNTPTAIKRSTPESIVSGSSSVLSGSSSIVGGATLPGIDTSSSTISGLDIGSGSRSGSRSSSRSSQTPGQSSESSISLKGSSVVQPPTTPNTEATPRSPFTRRTTNDPARIFPRLVLKRKAELFEQGYNVEARIGGVFKRISRSPLSLKEAVRFGSSEVGSSSAATFRITKSTQPIGQRFLGLGSVRDFDARAGGIFVEKREKRINTPGELIGITRKGQLAIKNRRLFK